MRSRDPDARPAPLTAAAERALLARAQRGDRDATERLVEAHMGFVVRVAASFHGASGTLEDLVQEGVLGLLAAVRAFDLERHPPVRLLTFAKSWIERDVRRARLRDDHRYGGSRIPEGTHLAAGRVTRAEQALRARLGRAPTARDLARETGLAPGAVRALLEVRARSLLLLDAEPMAAARISGAALGTTPVLLEAILRDEARMQVRQALERLPPAEAGSLRALYGIGEDEDEWASRPRGARAAARRSPRQAGSTARALHERALANLRSLLAVLDPAPPPRREAGNSRRG